MPRFSQVYTNAGAFADIRPLAGWQYEYLPWPAVVKVLATSATGTCTLAVNSGSEQIQRVSPVSSGGAVGTLPNSFSNEPLIFHAPAGDRLEVVLASTAAATVNLLVDVNPA